jgi:hypothetical protein
MVMLIVVVIIVVAIIALLSAWIGDKYKLLEDGDNRSSNYCTQISITNMKGENEKSSHTSSDVAMTTTTVQNGAWFIPSLPPIAYDSGQRLRTFPMSLV